LKLLGKITDAIEDYGIFVFLVAMFVLITFQVFFRYVLKIPLPWAEELARYCMIWASYLGVSACVKKNSHVGVDGLVNLMPGPVKRGINALVVVIVAAFNIALFILALRLTLTIAKNGQKSPALVMPMWLAYLALPTSFGLATLHSLTSLVGDVKNALKNDGESGAVS